MTTTFDIKTIQVMIYTNDRQNRIIEMKGSIFGFENVYAFFSDSTLYSPEALNELTGYDPVEKRRIFFDPDLFYNFLELSHSKNPTPDPNIINIRSCNFKTMIDALFVVSFPVPKNVELDYDKYNCIGITADFMVSSVRDFFQKNVYTYISSKNKKYTVLRTKWPNKITSNPDYSTSLVQALQIYNTGKTKFVDLKTAGINVIIKNLVNAVGDIPTVTTDVENHVFKSYAINDGRGKINDLIQNLNTKLKELQKDFYYYTFLWILYLSTEYDLPKDYFTTTGGMRTRGNFFVQPLITISKFKDWNVKTSSASTPAFSLSKPKTVPSTTTPAATSASDAALKRLFSSYIIKGDKQCNIQSYIRAQIISDLEKSYTSRPATATATEINISNSLHLNYLLLGLESNKTDFAFALDRFKNFVKKFMNETNIVGSSEFDMIIQADLNRSSVDTAAEQQFITALLNLRSKDMFNAGLCEYGFDTKTGLYYKIRDLIETIDFLGTSFKTTVADLSTSVNTPTIEHLEQIETDFKTRIVRVNEILENKTPFKAQDLEKIFENIITERRQIELTDTVETSRFQNTKKSRDPVWEKLYKESWYKNFANGLLEITQLRRSSNNDINTALGETGQYDIKKLQALVDTSTEAGIDEINIGGNRGENLPTFKANLICVVAGGEITDENRRAIQCPYSSQKMGSLLSRLVLKLPENEDLRRTDFVDLTSAIKKAEQDAAAKNKTRKKENIKDDNRLAKEYGVEKYDDETIKQFMRKGGEQGFLGNLFGQGQLQGKLQGLDQPQGQPSIQISGDVRQLIDDNIKVITNYDSTGLKTSSFSQRYIINSQDELIKFLVSKEPKTIPTLNEAIKISKEVLLDENKKTKIIEDINDRISKYESTIKNSKTRMGTQAYKDDETKKQQNYLELYNATIMKNLFDTVLETVDNDSSLSQFGNTGSPRGVKGGSHKLRNTIKKNRTQRKKNHRKKE
jgi:hypothetical protein